MDKLAVGDRFPRLSAPTAEGGTLEIPDDTQGTPVVLLLYRGRW